MPSKRKTPVIIGVGDIVNRSRQVEDALEPLELIVSAITKSLEDTGLSKKTVKELKSSIDSIDVVRTWTWPYEDLPGLIAERLGVRPRHTFYTEHGGDKPCKLLDDAARRICKGTCEVAVVAGGEALASLSACAAAKRLPPPNWTKVKEEVKSVFSPTTRQLKQDLGSKHSVGNPIHVYPMFENSLRAHRYQSIAENHDESSDLYADFARVAEQNEYSWNYGKPADTKETIATVSKKNRMICVPYPLLMNAFNTVNLAAAVIVTSTEYARKLGIEEDRWVYPLGGAGTRDSYDFWERPMYWWSPAISRSLDAGLAASGMERDDIDLFDFYSCFPIVPKLACHHLGLPITGGSKPITLLGGLTSFGGAGNNYSMHAITESVRQIRAGKGKTALILANGGVATYQFVLCLSRSPRRDGLPYPSSNPLPPVITDVQAPQLAEQASGGATIETYTVEYGRDGNPARGYIVGRLKSNGHRFIANHGDERTLTELCSQDIEPIGRSGKVETNSDGRNLFSSETGNARL